VFGKTYEHAVAWPCPECFHEVSRTSELRP
jgi:hypothetical protein